MPTSCALTIGHSNRTLEEFIYLLQAHGATRVVDVRTVPRSRHNPQFNRDTLPDALKNAGIGYIHMAGLRHPKADSVNMGWRNDSFRGFADYMQTPEFEAALPPLADRRRPDRAGLLRRAHYERDQTAGAQPDTVRARRRRANHLSAEPDRLDHDHVSQRTTSSNGLRPPFLAGRGASSE